MRSEPNRRCSNVAVVATVLAATLVVAAAPALAVGPPASSGRGWGDNGIGELGVSAAAHLLPTVIPAMSDITAVSAGHAHTLLLRSDGTVWSSGSNIAGQLGLGYGPDPTFFNTLQPLPHSTETFTQVPGLSSISKLSAGDDFSLALASDGTVWGSGATASASSG